MADILPSVHSTPLLVSEAPYTALHYDPTAGSASALYRQENSTRNTNGHGEDDEEEKWIWVLDPMTRKLRVPVHLLHPTQATATSGTVPSLCIAYLEGRCRHPWCRQAHVLPSAIPQLRYEALNAPTCCHLHSDPHDISKLTNRFRYIRIVNNGPNGDSELIETNRVASTVGLLRYLVHNVLPKKGSESANHPNEKDKGKEKEKIDVDGSSTNTSTNTGPTKDDVLELPAKFICRLHLAHRCRYLEDCNNIHLCREYELQLQPPPHVLGALSGVTTSTRTVTVGDTCYTVTPLAVGDVSDEDFQAISHVQKSQHRAANNASGAAGTSATANLGSGLNASSMPWAVSANPFEPVLGSTAGNSPMLYGCGGGAITPLSGPTNANGSATVFPSMPECWQATSALSSAMPGSSPFLQSTTSHPAGARSPSTHPSTHLRVYDVRPKHSSTAGGNSSSASSCLTAAGTKRGEQEGGATTVPTTASTTSSSTPASLKNAVGAAHPQHRSEGKDPATASAPVESSSNTTTTTTHVAALAKRGVTLCSSTTTDGGVSISTSGANTPVNDGGFTAFLQRISDTPTPKHP